MQRISKKVYHFRPAFCFTKHDAKHMEEINEPS